ncbi:MAG: hypothetical protein FJX57_22300, partial [Alphaproteobacteria bacterium]|nr:hypothetical protein [Alphaproteobacteria bacterium]
AAGPTRDGRRKPDLVAPGQARRPFAATSLGTSTLPLGVRTATAMMRDQIRLAGTSAAAPHVAGVVALLFQAANRALTALETRDVLNASAQPLHGISGWDPRRGHGRVDAVAALIELSRRGLSRC